MSVRLLLPLLAVVVGCSTAPPAFGGNRARASELEVFETTIRWVHSRYLPGETRGYPNAWCLAAGRRASTAVDRYRRGPDEQWYPSRRLLDRVSDLLPAVVPADGCHRNEDQEEEFGEGGPTAALLILEQPDWQSATQATIRVRTRETNFYTFVYSCRLEQRNMVWRMLECV